MSMFDLTNKIALVTGAGTGLGKAIVIELSRWGADIVVAYRSSRAEAEQVVNAIEEHGNRAIAVQGDVTDEEQVIHLVEQARMFGNGHIDILVNNAGIGGGDFSTTEEDEYDKVMDTNLKANFFLSRIIANRMIANNISGNILNIASSSSLRPANSAYVLSKWGVRSLTEGLALSLIPHNIVVNGIAPGPTATPMLHKKFSPDKSLTRLDNPIGRYVLPQEIAQMAVVLVSNMSRSIVGDIVYMTGGAGNLFNSDFEYKFC